MKRATSWDECWAATLVLFDLAEQAGWREYSAKAPWSLCLFVGVVLREPAGVDLLSFVGLGWSWVSASEGLYYVHEGMPHFRREPNGPQQLLCSCPSWPTWKLAWSEERRRRLRPVLQPLLIGRDL